MKILKDFTYDISRCVRCGTCRSVCPTFGVIKREAASARGKVSLADAYLRGEVELTDTVLKHITECVLCGACRQSCPNDVPVPDIMMAMRAEAVKERGLPFLPSFIMKNLQKPDAIIGKALKAASLVQGLLFKRVPGESGLHRRFPLPLIQRERFVPPLARRFFLDSVKRGGEVVSTGDRGVRVGFFAGCMVNYVMPNIGTASLKVLKKSGATVVVPQRQSCCGMPALGMGDVDDAKALALKNLEIFEGHDLDFVTASCATCSDGLKNRFRELLQDEGPDIKRRVNAFCDRVRDITELLVNDLGLTDGSLNLKSSNPAPVVTYHDPCHLRRGQGIKEEPRELIDMTGAKRKEMSHPCRCCGLGGSFNITHYDFSMAINRSKAEDIKETGANVAATACPGCIMQLRDGLNRVGANTEVRHVVELLAERIDDEE